MINSSNKYCFHLALKDLEHLPDYLKTTYVVNCILYSLFAVLTVFGNTVVLVAIRRNRSLHSPSNVLLACLALTDLAVGLFVEPSYVVYKIAEIHFSYKIVCELRTFMNLSGFVLPVASCLIVTIISTEKFLAVYLHLRYREFITIERLLIAVCACTFFAITLTVLLVWYSIVFLFTALVMFICLVVVLSVNIRMLGFIRHHHRQIRSMELSLPTSANGGSNHINNETRQTLKLQKSVCNLTWVVAAMLGCYIPYLCSLLARHVTDYPNMPVRFALNITYMITFANSAWNPIIYCRNIRDIRMAVLSIIHCT